MFYDLFPGIAGLASTLNSVIVFSFPYYFSEYYLFAVKQSVHLQKAAY